MSFPGGNARAASAGPRRLASQREVGHPGRAVPEETSLRSSMPRRSLTRCLSRRLRRSLTRRCVRRTVRRVGCGPRVNYLA